MDTRSYNIRVPKRWARITMIVGVTALIVAPLTAVATHTFNDVPNTHTFHADIEWLEASGVTKGCNPPANTQFCPDDNVTRGQMSAFMKRFAGYIGAEDGTPAQADHATTADNADNADTLDGIDSVDLLGVNSTGGNTEVLIDGTNLTSDYDDLGTATVTAPGDGAILMFWSGWIRCSGADEDEIRLFVNNTATDLFNVEECVSSASDRSVSAHFVQAVSEGASYTFEMRGHDFNNTPNITMRDQRISLMFVPFGVGESSPVITGLQGASQDGGSGSGN